jgi:hypothetical protein
MAGRVQSRRRRRPDDPLVLSWSRRQRSPMSIAHPWRPATGLTVTAPLI